MGSHVYDLPFNVDQGCFLLRQSEAALKPDSPMLGVPPPLGGDWGEAALTSSVWHGVCPP
jgi:hypothetical protein